MTQSCVALFHGDDLRVEQALALREQVLRAENPDIERIVRFADDLNPAELRIELQQQALFVQARHFIVRHADAVKRPKDLIEPLCIQYAPSTCVTILAASLSAGSGWIKGLKGVAEITAYPTPNRKDVLPLARQIFADHKLVASPSLIRDVVETSGGDLTALEQEARKLHAYVGGTSEAKRAFDQNAVRSLVFPSGETTIWPLLDRIGERNTHGAMTALHGLREEPVRVMSMIMRHLTRLSMVRALQDEGMNHAEIGKLLGSPAWQIRKLAAQAKRWSVHELTAALGRAIQLDLQVKSGDRRPHDAMLKLVIS